MAEERIDDKKVAGMRKLLAEGGQRAVEKRYGANAAKSAEFRRAQRQRDAVARHEREARRERVAQASERSKKASTPQKGGSARDRLIAAERERRDQPAQSRSR